MISDRSVSVRARPANPCGDRLRLPDPEVQRGDGACPVGGRGQVERPAEISLNQGSNDLKSQVPRRGGVKTWRQARSGVGGDDADGAMARGVGGASQAARRARRPAKWTFCMTRSRCPTG